MAANKPGYPNCGCAQRCLKPKCNRGSRELATSPDVTAGALTEVARGLASRRGAQSTMKTILKNARQSPVLSVICTRSRVSRTLLKYWLALSRKGRRGDFFDFPIDEGRTERFHILFEDAVESAWDNVEQKAYNLATGVEREILNHQGKVSYRYDQSLLNLGLIGEDAYLRDPQTGEPIPETVPMLDPEMVRWLLARRRSDQYGNKMQVDHTHKGGVLVVGVTKTSKELEATYNTIKNTEIEDVEFEEVPAELPPGVPA